MKKENILIIVLVGAILITVFVWFRYFQSQGGIPAVIPVTQNSEEDNAILAAGKEFIAILKTLEKIKLDTGFLEDPIYKKLRDLTPEIILPQEKGRENPFIPYEIQNLKSPPAGR